MLTPVGLDTDLLHSNYKDITILDLKKKYGFSQHDNILLFIGRLEKEKRPISMVEILHSIRKKNTNYKLLMVGNGELKNKIINRINELKLSDVVKIQDNIPNEDIWEYYRLSDAYVNLNQHEIFGMSILEAMFYGTKVVAWNAPGPNYIIENGVSGWIVDNTDKVIERILDKKDVGLNAHRRIIEKFTWENTANNIKSLVEKALQ